MFDGYMAIRNKKTRVEGKYTELGRRKYNMDLCQSEVCEMYESSPQPSAPVAAISTKKSDAVPYFQ
jgi:hypothetical protein